MYEDLRHRGLRADQFEEIASRNPAVLLVDPVVDARATRGGEAAPYRHVELAPVNKYGHGVPNYTSRGCGIACCSFCYLLPYLAIAEQPKWPAHYRECGVRRLTFVDKDYVNALDKSRRYLMKKEHLEPLTGPHRASIPGHLRGHHLPDHSALRKPTLRNGGPVLCHGQGRGTGAATGTDRVALRRLPVLPGPGRGPCLYPSKAEIEATTMVLVPQMHEVLAAPPTVVEASEPPKAGVPGLAWA